MAKGVLAAMAERLQPSVGCCTFQHCPLTYCLSQQFLEPDIHKEDEACNRFSFRVRLCINYCRWQLPRCRLRTRNRCECYAATCAIFA